VKACFGSSGRFFAMVITVRTDKDFHAVLMPAFNRPESVKTYLDFLADKETETMRAFDCWFDEENFRFLYSNEREVIRPKASESFTLE
jgi:hypothetical protein